MTRRQQLFILNVIWGIVSVVAGIAGLYFMFRYGVTVLASNDETKKLLLGDYVAGIVGNTEIGVVVAISLYMGFKVVYLIISTATLENWAEREYKSVYH